MSVTVTSQMVAAALEAAIPRLACQLPSDVYGALCAARADEAGERGRVVCDHLIENAHIACADSVPICQDTGTVWCSLEVGPDVLVRGDVFSQVDGAVARAYDAARLRKSLVRDAAFDRANTGDNTPCFTDIHPVDEPGVARIRIMLKGGGSDNASRVVMLVPGAGRAGIVDEVVRCVREKASSACAPLVVGVGIGATFDKVGGLAKRALMRRLDEETADEATADLERELLEAANTSGVGPGGLGGSHAVLGVRVSTAPCHIAALPLAINMGCSALRRATIDLTPDAADVDVQLDEQLVRFAADEGDSGAGRGNAQSLNQSCFGESATGAFASCGTRFVSTTPPSAQDAAPASEPIRLSLPFDREDLAKLRAGDACLLTGPIYTLRDAGHVRLLADMEAAGGTLPYGLEGQTIFYAGPTPAAAGRPFGAVGPTTAGRMDFAAPALYKAGVVATIGKGHRAADVAQACAETGSVFFTATGGAAALLAKQVTSAETVAYEDLGTEALRRIEVVDFPVFVGIDVTGADIYDEV